MTTPDAIAKTRQAPSRFRLPDPPEREPDENMTSFKHLARAGNAYLLVERLGNPDTTLVEADRWIVPDAGFNKARAKRPDLLVAFDVDPAAYEASNGYIVSEQGKPPDFVLEVASESTAVADRSEKRDYYAAIGVLEYWLFDETAEYHGTRLAGFRLAEEGGYHPIRMDVDTVNLVQGYSAALGLCLRWQQGELAFCDPTTDRPITTLADERAARISAEAQRSAEQARADAAEAELAAERARVRELEERLRRQNS